MKTNQSAPARWKSWFYWIVASAIGAFSGTTLTLLLESYYPITHPFSGFILIPSILATTQWLILRERFPHCGWWIPATTIGGLLAGLSYLIAMIAYQYSYFAPSIILAILLLGGIILGLAQYLVLHVHLARAGWWIVANTIGWPISLVALPYLLHQIAGFSPLFSTPEWPWMFSLGYVALSAITGVVLVRLQFPEQTNSEQLKPEHINSLARSH